jgi:hypothetical protein
MQLNSVVVVVAVRVSVKFDMVVKVVYVAVIVVVVVAGASHCFTCMQPPLSLEKAKACNAETVTSLQTRHPTSSPESQL